MFPVPFPPGTEIPPLSPFESFVSFFLAYLLLLGLFSLCLPRPWFVTIFRTAFPFMPERLEDFKRK
jgi:hypothetical protein